MNIIFLSISTAVSNINNKGIYPDLLRKFASEGHEVFIVCPFERKLGKQTDYNKIGNVHILGVKTLNITKTNIVEKGISTLLIEYQYKKAINKYFVKYNFDLILYSTPPITFSNLILYLKQKYQAKSYLLLKDIFPQNAVDLGLIKKNSLLHKFFKKKEKQLYEISDFIGCMSPANVEYIFHHNPEISRQKLEICPNCIELKENNSNISKEEFFLQYNLPANLPIVVYGGNLGKPQGIDFLIEVLNSNMNRSDVYFLIVGNGTYFNKLKNWTKIKMPKNILILPSLPQKEYSNLESFADIGMIFLDYRFTIPNFPSRILSYMNNKLPIIFSTDNNTDVYKIAEQNKFGLWGGSNDLTLFNQQINKLIEKSSLRKEMGENGYKFLTENYHIDVAYNKIVKHF